MFSTPPDKWNGDISTNGTIDTESGSLQAPVTIPGKRASEDFDYVGERNGQ